MNKNTKNSLDKKIMGLEITKEMIEKCDFKDGIFEGAEYQAKLMYSADEVLEIIKDYDTEGDDNHYLYF